MSCARMVPPVARAWKFEARVPAARVSELRLPNGRNGASGRDGVTIVPRALLDEDAGARACAARPWPDEEALHRRGVRHRGRPHAAAGTLAWGRP